MMLDAMAHCKLYQLYELFLVPETEANVLVAMGIADTSDTVFTPTECARSSVIVRKV